MIKAIIKIKNNAIQVVVPKLIKQLMGFMVFDMQIIKKIIIYSIKICQFVCF